MFENHTKNPLAKRWGYQMKVDFKNPRKTLGPS